MRSIWYLVGMMLLSMGTVIVITGAVDFFSPPSTRTVLAELHPGLWWGCIMVLAGSLFYFGARGHRNEP